jgi:P pilus assembly chaperone PapD
MRIESIIAVAIALLPWWFENPAAADMQAASSRVVLKGQSSGGTMTLMKIPSHEYPYVVVTNYTGDSASTVLERFQQALADCPPCQK